MGEGDIVVETSNQPPEAGGLGGDTPSISRGDLLKLRRAVESGLYEITPEMRSAWLKEANRIALGGEEERSRIRAIDLCRTLDNDNVRRLEVVDKMDRLDNQQPTEITHGVQVLIQELDGPQGVPYTPQEQT